MLGRPKCSERLIQRRRPAPLSPSSRPHGLLWRHHTTPYHEPRLPLPVNAADTMGWIRDGLILRDSGTPSLAGSRFIRGGAPVLSHPAQLRPSSTGLPPAVSLPPSPRCPPVSRVSLPTSLPECPPRRPLLERHRDSTLTSVPRGATQPRARRARAVPASVAAPSPPPSSDGPRPYEQDQTNRQAALRDSHAPMSLAVNRLVLKNARNHPQDAQPAGRGHVSSAKPMPPSNREPTCSLRFPPTSRGSCSRRS